MAKKALRKNEPKLRLTVRHALTNIYVVLLFTVFPLFLSNYYSAARRDKFWSFLVITTIIGVAVGIISLVDLFARNNEYNRKLNTYRDPFKVSLTDIALFAFAGVSFVGTLFSGNVLHSLIGLSGGESNGRNMGLVTILLLFVCYMVISRFFYYQEYVIYCMFFGMTVVSLLAILNYYYIDPLHMFDAYKGSANFNTVTKDFTSTIGNKNYLSALICVALPFSVGLAVTTKDKILKIVSYVSTGLQFMGLLVATSDGGFLGCFIAFAVIAIVCTKDIMKLCKFCFCVAIMMASAKTLQLFDLIMDKNSKGYSSFSEFFIYNNYIFILFVVFFSFAAVLFAISQKKSDTAMLSKCLFYVVIGIVSAAVLAVAALIVKYTFIDTTTKLEGFRRFLRFNEGWGTHRGYFWIRTIDIFKESSVFKLLFGSGPDTYYFRFLPYFSELNVKYNESSTNAAHNVYLNYLITHGILGFGAYLLFVGSSIVRTFKRAADNPLALIALGVIVAYAVQDFVNIANPVNTPWFFAFIALSEATLLRANTTERLNQENF